MKLNFLKTLLAIIVLSNHAHVFTQCPDVNASFITSLTDICGPGPQVISFTNSSAGVNNGTSTYEWFLDGVSFDNTTGLAVPGTSNVSAIGTYIYMLVATDPSVPCTDTATVVVNIYPIPNASFTFNPNNQCAELVTTFANNSTGGGAPNYTWNFGDGNTSTATNPNNTYMTGGTYNASLTMNYGPGCSDVVTNPVTVMPVPNVVIGGDDGDGDLINCLLPTDPSTTETVTFTNGTTNGVSYSWDFGDGSPIFNTNSLVPFTHDYTAYGTYTVTMTATHANGCTSSQTLTVVFEKYVSAAMTLDITEYSGCTPHPMSTLTNLSVNANSYIWDFGDGTVITTTSATPPSYSYSSAGTYTISLTAINSCNTANSTISPIIIVDGPTTNFATSLPGGGGGMGCAPQTVTYTNTSSNVQPANNYQWDMGNGNTYTNTATPPNQTYDTTGVYTVTLIAGNACGFDTIQYNVTIDTVPVVQIISTPLDGCSPLTVATTNNSYTDPINYAWYVDGIYSGNASTLADQTFINTSTYAPVNHTIQLNGSNFCGNDSDSETIIVHPETLANFFIDTDTICEGGSINFTDASFGEGLTWEWDFGISIASSQGPHNIQFNTAGTYTIELIVDAFCGPDTMTMNIVVLPIPIADFTANPLIGCVGMDVTLTNNSTIGGIYIWDFAAGTPGTSNVYSPAPVNFPSAGLQTITLDVDVLGCTNADTAYIDVNPLPVPVFALVPNNGCTPLQVAFNNTSAITVGDTYNWNLGNGNTSNGYTPADEIYTAASNDSIYTVQLIITTAAGCIDSLSNTITVHPLPIADYTPLPDTACAGENIGFLNNSIGASSYQWDFGDATSSTLTSPFHAYTLTGDIITELIVTTVFGCTDTLQVPIYIDSIPTANFNFNIVCDIDTTNFTDLSIGGVTDWEWSFGDGSPLDNSTNPNHFYGVSGTYTVGLTVTNPAGCTNTLTQLVDVSTVPVAAFSTSSTCLGSLSLFTDQSAGITTSWEWDFGDATPLDNTQNPTHLYAGVGVYNVEMIAMAGNGCSDTIVQQITVTAIPTADFTFTSVCTNDTTYFLDLSAGGPDTYFWNFGDGTTDNTNNPNPAHQFTTSGSYNVMLVAGYSASGCTDTIIYTVDAFPRTVPNFSTNTPCLGGATIFTDLTSGTPTIWSWDFGDGSPVDNTANPVHVYTAGGIYNVGLITENTFSCIDTFNTTVQVFPLPLADFTFNVVCLNALTSFTDNSTSAVAWEWDFGDGSPFDLNTNPSHTYLTSGNFDVQLVVTNSDGCTDTMIQSITVNPNPFADFNMTTACHTYPSYFTDNSTGVLIWYWDFGDASPIDNSISPNHTYTNDGAYVVELIVENVFGCTDTSVQNIDVLVQPQAGFLNNNVCAGETVIFTDTSTLGPTTWEWDFGDGTPIENTQNPSHLFSPGGTYNVSLIVGNIAGCMDTIIVPVDVYTIPVPDFTADTVCLFSITSFTDLTVDIVPISSWFYDFDDGNNSVSSDPTYIFQNPGTYNVSLTVVNVNGCDSTIIHPVFVSDIPVATFDADTVCMGSPTTFTDVSTGIPTGWLWDFGDGNVSSTGPTVQHTYGAPGSYVVSLIVSAGGACTDQVYGIVEVSDNVQAGIITLDSICDGVTAVFIDNSTITSGIIDTYFWDFGDGVTSTSQDDIHDYTAPGSYTVIHTVSNAAGCSSTEIMTVTVIDAPIAVFVDLPACQNNVTSFSDQSILANGSIISWNWDFGDGTPVETSQNPNHVFGTDGNFMVSLTVTTDFGCSDNTVIPVIVYPAPIADFSAPIGCPSDTIQYTDLSTITSGSVVGWDWSFDDGGTDNIQHPQHDFQIANDSFYVTLIATSNFGCTDTAINLIQTYPYPDFNFGPDWTSGCQPFQVNFEDLTSVLNGVITNWEWDFDDGTQSYAQSPTHIFTDEGDYYVGLSVTTSDGCNFDDSLLYPIIVYPIPEAGFSPIYADISVLEAEVDFIDQSNSSVDWEWSFGDGSYSNMINPTHEFLDTGTYEVMQIVYSDFGCVDTAINYIHVFGEFAFYISNAFTPNGDHKNNTWRGYGMSIQTYDLRVFNRWGEEIFQTNEITQEWDGSYDGVPVVDDVYVWRVFILDVNGEEHEYFGHVTVLK